jgi:hypothetical protein
MLPRAGYLQQATRAEGEAAAVAGHEHRRRTMEEELVASKPGHEVISRPAFSTAYHKHVVCNPTFRAFAAQDWLRHRITT